MPRRILGFDADPTVHPGESLERQRIMMDRPPPRLSSPGNRSVPKVCPPVFIGPTRSDAPPVPASIVGPIPKPFPPIPDRRDNIGPGNFQAIVLTSHHQELRRDGHRRPSRSSTAAA